MHAYWVNPMSKTIENLKEAFAGESQANLRYLAYAQKAEEEALFQIAKLFKAAAEAETVHAHNHLRVLSGIKSTQENLETAVSGETFEFKTMYPEYLAKAEDEGNKQAAWSFDVANQVEQIHAKLFSKAIDTLQKGEKPISVDYFVCSVCGNTVEGKPPSKCPICGAPEAKFSKAN
jgi:rubrerythrin